MDILLMSHLMIRSMELFMHIWLVSKTKLHLLFKLLVVYLPATRMGNFGFTHLIHTLQCAELRIPQMDRIQLHYIIHLYFFGFLICWTLGLLLAQIQAANGIQTNFIQ
jgi:hypothetical protein